MPSLASMSQNSSGNVENVSNSISDTTAAITTIVNNSQSQYELSQELFELVSKFKL